MNATAVAEIENGSVSDIRITNAGIGYTGPVTIVVDPPPLVPRVAKGLSEIVNGFVVSLTVTDPGYGYKTEPPVLLVGGGGTGATARAILSDGAVTGFLITNPGSGYTAPPQVVIASPFHTVSLGVRISRVTIDLHLEVGYRYLLESSIDLQNWEPIGQPFVAQQNTMAVELPVSNSNTVFRLKEYQ